MPPEDPLRPGPKYKVPPPFDPDGADRRSSAWASFRQANSGKPGMPTGNMFKTPNKHGFNPNTPGSDEKPAPGADRHRFTGYANDDFLGNRADPRGPPVDHASTSPTSPRSRRPNPNPQRPFSGLGRVPDDQVPFAEGNRERTPYTRSFYGKQADLLREGLRRSHSFRESAKSSPEDGSRRARARSSSPHRANQEQSHRRDSSDAESSGEDDVSGSPDGADNAAPHNQQPGGASANGNAASGRPKKVPTGPSRRFANGSADGAQSDTEQPRAQPNMYDKPPSSFSSSCISRQWMLQMFGSHSTSRAKHCGTNSKIPAWAIPSSLNPTLRSDRSGNISRSQTVKEEFVTGADPVYIDASPHERAAFLLFQTELKKDFGDVPGNLDMDIFLKLVATWRRQESSGDPLLDRVLQRVLQRFESSRSTLVPMADHRRVPSRFSYAYNPELYRSAEAKTRSEENINTTFSPDGWTGSFTGEPDYFSSSTDATRNQPSPSRRPTPNRSASSQQRSATLDVPTPGGSNTHYEEVPQRPWGSDGTPSEIPRTAAASAGFDGEEWQRKFQDPTWSWPSPPPNPPSPSKGGRKQSQNRKAGKGSAREPADPNARPNESETPEVQDTSKMPKHDMHASDGDAMDIDDAPPAQQRETQSDQDNGARAYPVPTTEWVRQQHEHNHRAHRKSSAASRKTHRAAANHTAAKFNANLDDLRKVEPLAQRSTAGEALNVADMEQALPFQSQASGTVEGDPLLPRDLQIPAVPVAPSEPQRLSKLTWQAHAGAFAEYVKAFHRYNNTLLQHFQAREQQAQDQMANGMGWLEATGDTSGMLTAPTGFGTYLRGVKEDRAVREAWLLAWERHRDAVLAFEKIRDRVRRLVVGGMLVDS